MATSVILPRPRRFRRRLSPAVLVTVILALILFLGPTVMLVVGSFRNTLAGQPGEWTLQAYADAYTDGPMFEALANSIILSLAVVSIAMSLAVVFAWLVTRTNTPLRRFVTPIMVVIFIVPGVFFTLSWSMLGNEPAGLINRLWQALVGDPTAAIINVKSWFGLILVSSLKFTATIYLLCLGPFKMVDRSLEEAALTSGASRLRTFFTITIPVLAPGLTGPLILSLIAGIGMLDAPLFLGRPAGINVFGTQVYDYITLSTPSQYGHANALSVLLMVLVLLLVALQRRALNRRSFTTISGKSFNNSPMDLGRWKHAGAALIVLYAIFGLILPIFQLVLGSFQPYFGVYRNFTLANYEFILSDPTTLDSFKTTFMVGVLCGLFASALGFLLAYVAARHHSRIARGAVLGSWVIFAMPGITLSLAIISAYLAVPGLRWLYGTPWIVLIALTIGFAPIATRLGEGAYAQLSAELEESAQVHGASPTRSALGISLRLVMPTFLLSWIFTGVHGAGNLDIPILMSDTTNNPTVAILVYDFYAIGRTSQASAVFCLFLLAVLAILGAVILLRNAVSFVLRRTVPGYSSSPSVIHRIVPGQVPQSEGQVTR